MDKEFIGPEYCNYFFGQDKIDSWTAISLRMTQKTTFELNFVLGFNNNTKQFLFIA